ncbi:MAG: hypothetical protein BGO98_05795 [Myxococcales bacterium 68-20]|nr:MAG: hypothetical protein BGO98_05795 [Myxococcales bacterium 68-20]
MVRSVSCRRPIASRDRDEWFVAVTVFRAPGRVAPALFVLDVIGFLQAPDRARGTATNGSSRSWSFEGSCASRRPLRSELGAATKIRRGPSTVCLRPSRSPGLSCEQPDRSKPNRRLAIMVGGFGERQFR